MNRTERKQELRRLRNKADDYLIKWSEEKLLFDRLLCESIGIPEIMLRDEFENTRYAMFYGHVTDYERIVLYAMRELLDEHCNPA